MTAKEVQNIKCWKAHFKDATHDVDIEILNTEEEYRKNPLRFELDGIKFQGGSIGDFSLAEESQAAEAMEKFSILKWGGNSTKYGIASPYRYDLQRYCLSVEVPVCLIRKKDAVELQGVLCLAFAYKEHDKSINQSRCFCDDTQVFHDDAEVSDFYILAEGKEYRSGKNTLYFYLALNDALSKMKEDYQLKSCFTCQFSEYSPYGNDDYGTMLCYKKHKEECLKVHCKDDYFEYLEGKELDVRQETYICEEYEARNKACGYRGFVEGIS